MKNSELERLINDKLNSASFSDYAPNGLQVEGREQVQKIVTGVTASQALIDEAIRSRGRYDAVYRIRPHNGDPERYVHATAKSSRFGFVDDVELLYDPAAGLLQARGASRVGKSDLGVNRRRLEQLFKDAGL